MSFNLPRAAAGLTAILLLAPPPLQAAGSTQLWTGFVADWPMGDDLHLAVDVEPRTVLSGGDDWTSVGVTPRLEYAASSYVDLVLEGHAEYVNEFRRPDIFEVAARAGARVHLRRGRNEVRDLVRVEGRTLYYDDDTQDSEWRVRNRLEARRALNRPRTSDPGAAIALADWEWFIPIDDEVRERFAARHRIRLGLGYHWTEHWRGDVAYVWQRSRNTYERPAGQDDQVLEVKLKLLF